MEHLDDIVGDGGNQKDSAQDKYLNYSGKSPFDEVGMAMEP